MLLPTEPSLKPLFSYVKSGCPTLPWVDVLTYRHISHDNMGYVQFLAFIDVVCGMTHMCLLFSL